MEGYDECCSFGGAVRDTWTASVTFDLVSEGEFIWSYEAREGTIAYTTSGTDSQGCCTHSGNGTISLVDPLINPDENQLGIGPAVEPWSYLIHGFAGTTGQQTVRPTYPVSVNRPEPQQASTTTGPAFFGSIWARTRPGNEQAKPGATTLSGSYSESPFGGGEGAWTWSLTAQGGNCKRGVC